MKEIPYVIITGFFTVFGTITGSVIAYYFSRNTQKNTAKFELVEHLCCMIHEFRWSNDHSLRFILDVFIKNDVSLRVKIAKLEAYIWCPCKRKRLRMAKIKYLGDDEKASQPGIPCTETPKTIEKARDQLSELLGVIEKI